jgi:hypothetical protein
LYFGKESVGREEGEDEEKGVGNGRGAEREEEKRKKGGRWEDEGRMKAG